MPDPAPSPPPASHPDGHEPDGHEPAPAAHPSSAGDGPDRPATVGGAVTGWVEHLDPSAFAAVMASGIVSVSAAMFHERVLSDLTLLAAEIAFVVVGLGYLARAVRYPAATLASLRDPAAAMGYGTLVAGLSVVGVRLLMDHHTTTATILGAVAGALWLGTGYLLPWSFMVGGRPVTLRAINGGWLLWVVSTQSVAVLAAALSDETGLQPLREGLPELAVVFWGIGIVLYLIVIALIFQRLFLVQLTPRDMTPAYWIAMGATAISVRAAGGILAINDPGARHLINAMHPVLVGLSMVLWGFGIWWIPLLLLFGFWRYLARHYPIAYESRLWSEVFPLGMFTVASAYLGRIDGLEFLSTIAGGWLWVGIAAWAAVLAAMVITLAVRWTRRVRRTASERRSG